MVWQQVQEFEAAESVSTSELADRFGVTSRAVRYVLKADAERQADTVIPTAAASLKVTQDELAALDEILTPQVSRRAQRG